MAEVEQKFGKDCRYAQMLRDQLAEEANDKADHETWFIGSVPQREPKPAK